MESSLFIIVVGQSLDSDSTCGALYHSIHKDSGGPGVGPRFQVKKLKERKKEKILSIKWVPYHSCNHALLPLHLAPFPFFIPWLSHFANFLKFRVCQCVFLENLNWCYINERWTHVGSILLKFNYFQLWLYFNLCYYITLDYWIGGAKFDLPKKWASIWICDFSLFSLYMCSFNMILVTLKYIFSLFLGFT